MVWAGLAKVPQPIRRKRRAGGREVTVLDVELDVKRPAGVRRVNEPFLVRRSGQCLVG